jgi:hypothetical protein
MFAATSLGSTLAEDATRVLGTSAPKEVAVDTRRRERGDRCTVRRDSGVGSAEAADLRQDGWLMAKLAKTDESKRPVEGAKLHPAKLEKSKKKAPDGSVHTVAVIGRAR